MQAEHGTDLPVEAPRASVVPETIEEKPQPLSLVPAQITVQELLAKAVRHGFKEADIVTVSKLYHNQPNIYRLAPEQVADLDRRLSARIDKTKAAGDEAQAEQPQQPARAQAARSVKRA